MSSRSRVSRASAVRAAPQPMVVSSCSASTLAGGEVGAHAASSRGTSRMKTGRPLPSTVTAERPATALERRAERLQDRLLLAEQRVHRQADAPVAPLGHHHGAVVAAGRLEAEQRGQVVHRHQLAVVGEQRRRRGSGPGRRSATLGGAVDLGDGQPQHLVAHPHQQHRLHRHGERQPQGDAGAEAAGALQLEGAAHRLHGPLDRVEPDPAAGDVGDLLGGGDARQAGQQQRLAVGERAPPARR